MSLLLTFSRDKEGLCTGNFAEVIEDSPFELDSFVEIAFSAMLMRLSLYAKETKQQTVRILERAGAKCLYEVTLDKGSRALLLDNPLALVQQLSPPPRVENMHITRTVNDEAARIVPTGLELLRDSFGHRVYLRLRNDGELYECPVSGAWRPTHAAVTSHSERWCSLSVVRLLEFDVPRFYIPRAWNPSGGWISRAELQARYDTFLQEVESHESFKQ